MIDVVKGKINHARKSMITAILLSEKFENYHNSEGNRIESIFPLSKINIVVGSNNSGKSRFMRLLAMQPYYEVNIPSVDLEKVNCDLVEILGSLESNLTEYGLTGADTMTISVLSDFKKLPAALKTNEDVYASMRSRFEEWKVVAKFQHLTGPNAPNIDPRWLGDWIKSFRTLASRGLEILKEVPVELPSPVTSRVYIPILRGLRPLDEHHTDFYANRTIIDYFGGEGISAPEIFTGLSFYQSLTNLLLGSNSERKQIERYQKFISQALFEGYEVTLIPSPKNKVIEIKIGDEQQQPVHHLGDGIQSAIILSYLPFVTQTPTVFFIEEPELHMHPGLQRKILELFNSNECKQHMFFLTTHSNHLLDITIDLQNTSIFNFQKRLKQDEDDDEQLATVIVESVDAGHSSSLEELGVRNSSVFLVNSTIWVEGITDRWYLREYLESYVRFLKAEIKIQSQPTSKVFTPEEDTHFSFVEYGGGNITHFSFLDKEEHPIQIDRLCGHAMLIVDRDGDAKLDRKEKLEKKLGDRFYILAGREIENTLPPEVILAVVASYEKGTGVSDLPALKLEDYEQVYLGSFIEEWLQKNGGTMKRVNGYKGESGTIKAKVTFCKKAIKHLRSIEFGNLPVTTQEIARKMYDFIHSCNSV